MEGWPARLLDCELQALRRRLRNEISSTTYLVASAKELAFAADWTYAYGGTLLSGPQAAPARRRAGGE